MTMSPYAPTPPPVPTNGGYGYQPAAAVSRPSDVDSWTLVLGATAALAEQICNTDFVPKEMRGNAAAVTAAILTGREIGIGPMTSLAHINIVKGKPGQSAQLMRQLVLAAGHSIRYLETSDTRVVVEGRRKGDDRWERFSFTADQAKRAGIQFLGYPEDKLVARATSRLCRRLFADCLGGMPYTIEELTDGGVLDEENQTDQTPTAIAAPRPTRRTAQRRTQPRAVAPAPEPPTEPVEDPEGPPLPGEDGYDETPTTDAPATRPQLTKLHTIFSKGGVDNRDTRLQACSLIVGRELASSADLSKEEAIRLIETLEDLAKDPSGLAEMVAELVDTKSGDDA